MKAKGELSYSVVYDKEGKTVNWRNFNEMDYFYARYCYIVMLESSNEFTNLKLLRHTCMGADVEPLVEVIAPAERSQYDARYAVLGTQTPTLDGRYSDYVKTEGEAAAFGKGVELGIARSSTFLQCAAANTSDDSTSSMLDEYACELLIHAPAYHVQYKSLTAALNRNAELERELASIKTQNTLALAEYHQRLGKTPAYGIMDLVEVRKLLEHIDKL